MALKCILRFPVTENLYVCLEDLKGTAFRKSFVYRVVAFGRGKWSHHIGAHKCASLKFEKVLSSLRLDFFFF